MEEDRPTPLRSYAESSHKPGRNSISDENWVACEDPIREVLNSVYPTLDSEEKRKDVIEYMQKLIRSSVGAEVFPYGSVPLKTYLPDGDIDLTALSKPNKEAALPQEVLAVLQSEEQNANTEFQIKEIRFIDAEVKIIKCIVQDIVMDVSFNQLGGLCALSFLEKVDQFIGKDHLFKRSIMLIKAWCYYESRILGAHHALISTYALETLVLYIFHVFNDSLTSPLVVLYRFLDYYSNFDWDNYCISLDGPVNKSLLPNIVVEYPVKQGTDGGNFLKSFVDMFMVPSKGSETVRTFTPRDINIIDPLKENNNLGRSVNRANYYRIRSALRYGARKLGEILELPSSNVGEEMKKFFVNTLQRHKSKCIPDTVLTFGTFSMSSFSEEANYENNVQLNADPEDEPSELSNADLEDEPSESANAADIDEERSGSNDVLTVDMNMMSSHGDVLEDFLLDFGDQDAMDGFCDTETLNPFADLTGDYDGHLRNLIYSQGCHGFASSAALTQTSPPALNQNAPYLTSFLMVHGTRPYFHMMNSTRGRGRSRGPIIPIRQVQWGRRGSDEINLALGGPALPARQQWVRRVPVASEREQGLGHGQPGSPSQVQVNSQRKLEFGSFGPLQESTSDAVVSQSCIVYGRIPGRFRIEPLRLRNEDEFPPLCSNQRV